MGVGYLFGCLLSIIMWKVDRHELFYKFNTLLRKRLKNNAYIQLFYLIFVGVLCLLISLISNKELQNGVVAFLVIEVSNSERKTLINKTIDKKHFYDTLSIISRSLVCGFIAPIVYIICFGNVGGIAYTLIYYISFDSTLSVFNFLNRILNIIPSLITVAILYVIYVPRNKTFKIDFKGDFSTNIIYEPLLNVYILSAYIESVNFYYHIEKKNVHYLKSYGVYTNKINDVSIKDFLSLIYSVCFIVFVAFWLYKAEIVSFLVLNLF
ncbi:hypothetical protein [Clostridium sp.]|uniref:hypothetical protein n=1 Tax=Clostridium sp. TaxID=1506 RepID=UPI002FC8029E